MPAHDPEILSRAGIEYMADWIYGDTVLCIDLKLKCLIFNENQCISHHDDKRDFNRISMKIKHLNFKSIYLEAQVELYDVVEY